MTLAEPTVTVFLDLPADGGNFFVLGDPVKGVLGNTTYTLGGDLGTDLTGAAYDITIRRGRASELDSIGPGTAEVAFRNHNRDFDGLNTASPYYDYLKPGRPMHVSIYGQRIFTGEVDDWALSYTVGGDALASAPAIDALGLLARREFDEWTSTPQASGARVSAILDRSEISWPSAKRSIGTGVASLQGDLVSWGSNCLNYLQLVALSELGVVFADRHGTITFRDRHSLTNPTPVITFADDGADVKFHGATMASAGKRYANRVGIDRVDGTLQTAADSADVDQNGARSITRSGLLMDSDAQSESMANFLLNLYKDPKQTVETITVNVTALDDANRALVSALDIYDAVGVRWTPRGVGSEIVETMAIEGLEHSIPFDGCHMLTLMLSPISQKSVFVLGDPVLGVLGGPGRLAF